MILSLNSLGDCAANLSGCLKVLCDLRSGCFGCVNHCYCIFVENAQSSSQACLEIVYGVLNCMSLLTYCVKNRQVVASGSKNKL